MFLFLAVASKPPEFDQAPPNRTEVKAQDLISLRCRSKPPVILPTVWDWRKDGKPLRADDINSNRITMNAGQLLIKSATREDSGNYTCILVNSAGNVTSNMSEVVVKGELFKFCVTSVKIYRVLASCMFPVLCTGGIFSRAWHRRFFCAWHRFHVFPLLAPPSCFLLLEVMIGSLRY